MAFRLGWAHAARTVWFEGQGATRTQWVGGAEPLATAAAAAAAASWSVVARPDLCLFLGLAPLPHAERRQLARKLTSMSDSVSRRWACCGIVPDTTGRKSQWHA